MQGVFVEVKSKKVKLYYKTSKDLEIKLAESKYGLEFTKSSRIPKKLPTKPKSGKTVPDFKWNNKKVVYFGGDEISFGKIKTIVKEENKIEVDFAIKTNQGIFLIYHTYAKTHLRD